MSSRNLWQFVRACEAQHLDADLRDFVEHAQRFRYPAAAVDVEEQRRRVARDVLAEARCAQRTWLAYQHLPVTDPEPGQWHDSCLAAKSR